MDADDNERNLARVSEPHALEAAKVLSAFAVDGAHGLDSEEAARRLELYGPNELRRRQKASLFGILLNQFKSPIVFLLVGAAVLSLAFGETVEFFAIVAVLAINAAIGFTTEMQAVRSMEALRELTSRSALVRRNGTIVTIAAEKLVPGDIVVIDAGDVVAADMRLIASSNLSVDESALTGESLPVAKSVAPVASDTMLADRTPMLFKGCAVTGGTGEAVVTGSGMNTELGRITRLVDEAAPERSPLERQLALLSRNLIWLTLAITALVAIAGIVAGQDITLMIESAVALAVAAIPEGLPIVATLALARGMLRMARHNALIEQLIRRRDTGRDHGHPDRQDRDADRKPHVGRPDRHGLRRDDVRPHDGNFILNGHPVQPVPEEDTGCPAQCGAVQQRLPRRETAHRRRPAIRWRSRYWKWQRRPGVHRVTNCCAKPPEVREHAFDTHTRMMATVHEDSTTASSSPSRARRKPCSNHGGDGCRQRERDRALSTASSGATG
jgi:hypothetical protein